MAIALTKLRGRVQYRLRDKDGRMDGPSSVEIDMALADAYIALSADLPAPMLYTANALTISAGSDLFTLPVTVTGSGYGTGTVEYAGAVYLQLVSNGQFLRQRSLEELNAWRDGQPTIVLGMPTEFTVYADLTQVIRGRCYPGAKVAEVCNLYSSMAADDLRDYVGTGGAEGLDTVTVNLSREAATALVARTAAILIKRMDETTVKARGINPQVANDYEAEAKDLMYEDAAKRAAFESTGRTQQWIP